MTGRAAIMVDGVLRHLQAHMSVGIVPVETEVALKAVWHGKGEPVTHRFGRKVCVRVPPS